MLVSFKVGNGVEVDLLERSTPIDRNEALALASGPELAPGRARVFSGNTTVSTKSACSPAIPPADWAMDWRSFRDIL